MLSPEKITRIFDETHSSLTFVMATLGDRRGLKNTKTGKNES